MIWCVEDITELSSSWHSIRQQFFGFSSNKNKYIHNLYISTCMSKNAQSMLKWFPPFSLPKLILNYSFLSSMVGVELSERRISCWRICIGSYPKLMNCIRDCNVTLRWLMLHNCEGECCDKLLRNKLWTWHFPCYKSAYHPLVLSHSLYQN